VIFKNEGIHEAMANVLSALALYLGAFLISSGMGV
jgi:hypothetical protein